MNKELTPLEALKWLKENKRKHWLDGDISNECLFTIENALKDYEKNKLFINEILDMLSNDNNINDVLNDIEESDSYEDFVAIYSSCPKEKYDLLKEVLL